MNTARLALRILQNRAGLVPRPSWCSYRVRTAGIGEREMEVSEVGAAFTRLGRLDGVLLEGPEPLEREDLDEVLEAIVEHARPRLLVLRTAGQDPERAEALARGLSETRGLHILVDIPRAPGREDPLDAHRCFVRAFQTLELLRAVALERCFFVGALRSLERTEDRAELRRLRTSLATVGVPLFVAPGERGPTAPTPALELQLAAEVLEDCDEPGRPRAAERWMLEQTVGVTRRARCAAMRSHVHLGPDGRVRSCAHRASVVGDLRRSEMAELWFGPEAERARTEVDGCTGCSGWSERIPGAFYRGELSATEPARLGVTRRAVGAR